MLLQIRNKIIFFERKDTKKLVNVTPHKRIKNLT